jgi:hypothetical protein
MYRDEDNSQRHTDNKSSFKKSSAQKDQRRSLFEWGSKPRARTKVYASNNMLGRMTEADRTRKSADCARASRSTWAARANDNRHYLSTVYGVKPKRNRELTSINSQKGEKEGEETKGLLDKIVKKEILELGRDEDIYNDNSNEIEVIQ